MSEPLDPSDQAGCETIPSEQDTRKAGEAEPPQAEIRVEEGDPQLLIITLPEFRRGYEAGKQAMPEEEGWHPFLLDTEVLEILKDFAAEGLFTDADENLLHWQIGQLVGQLERAALHSGGAVQRTIVQVKENLVLTISLTPVARPD